MSPVTGVVPHPSGAPPAFDPRAIGGGPWGTFVYGPSRAAVLRVAFALARANDPNPMWVDIRDRSHTPEVPGPGELGWVPADHLLHVPVSEAEPEDGVANVALWSVVRSDEPGPAIDELTEFLRLPSPVQDAVSRVGAAPARPALVVANSDLVRAHYPRDLAGVRRIVDAMLRSGVLPIVTSVGPPGDGRMAFDFVFDVRATEFARWKDGNMVCEKAPTGTQVPVNEPMPLRSIPSVADYLEART